jgi:hypothetical protein
MLTQRVNVLLATCCIFIGALTYGKIPVTGGSVEGLLLVLYLFEESVSGVNESIGKSLVLAAGCCHRKNRGMIQ